MKRSRHTASQLLYRIELSKVIVEEMVGVVFTGPPVSSSDPGVGPGSPALRADSLPTEPPGKP